MLNKWKPYNNMKTVQYTGVLSLALAIPELGAAVNTERIERHTCTPHVLIINVLSKP